MLRGYREKKGEIEMNNTMTIMGNNTTMTKCYANVGKNRTWFQRLKGYFLDNADYFATASVMLNGNAASAAQIMKIQIDKMHFQRSKTDSLFLTFFL